MRAMFSKPATGTGEAPPVVGSAAQDRYCHRMFWRARTSVRAIARQLGWSREEVEAAINRVGAADLRDEVNREHEGAAETSRMRRAC